MNPTASQTSPARAARPRRRTRAVAVLALSAGALTLAAAPAASAESIVVIKDANVWLTTPDGSRQHQVTSDGTADSPYRSPSQADDGTIAVSHQHLIKRLQQNGQVINTIDPPPLVDSTSRPVDGIPVAVAISPDGSKIAYSFSSYSCPIVWECGARAVTGITHADRFTPAGTFASATFGNPRWAGNGRLIVTGGENWHVNLMDAAAGSNVVNWFNDRHYFADNSDMGEAVVSRDGRRAAAVHGYDGEWPGSVRRIIWFNVAGDVRSGALPAPRPDGVCITAPTRGTHSPTWSPDGSGLAYTLPDGLYVARPVTTDGDQCASFKAGLALAGATEPDWGPAAIDPQPIPGPPGPPPPGPNPNPNPNPTPNPNPDKTKTKSKKATLSVVGKASRRTVTRKGLRVRVSGLVAGKKATVRLRVNAKTAKRLRLGRKAVTLASGSAKASKQGTASVRLKFTSKAAKAVRKQKRKIVASLSAPGAATKKVTLR
ncbi:MAG: PD40 domain-containing protein [Patulibacter sp.]|nr:PD40 domain-containing protein [Patulibacter sp.]